LTTTKTLCLSVNNLNPEVVSVTHYFIRVRQLKYGIQIEHAT